MSRSSTCELWGQRLPQLGPHWAALPGVHHLPTDDLRTGQERGGLARLTADEGALEHAMELLIKHGAIPDTVARARHYGEIARVALAPLPAGDYKDALLEVVEFCVSRVS